MTPDSEHPETEPSPTIDAIRRLALSRRDVVIGGVCGGLGTHTPLPAWVWRVGFLLLFFYLGTGLIPYLLLWICLPQEGSQQ